MPGVATELNLQLPTLAWQADLDEAIADLSWQGGKLYTAAADGSVHRYDEQGNEVSRWQAHEGGVIRVATQPHGKHVATAGEDGRIQLWTQDSERREELVHEPRWIEHLQWTPDGKILAAAAERTIYLWRVTEDKTESLGVWYDAKRNVLAMAWAPDNQRLASACNKGLYLWRVGTSESVQLLDFPGAPVSVAWSHEGSALAVGTQDGFLQIWRKDNKGRSKQLTMRGYRAKVTCLDWHPAKPTIATAGGNDVVIWDLSSNKGNKPMPLRRHESVITGLAYSPTGRHLFSGDRQGRLCIWNLKRGLEYECVLDDEIACAQWSADGHHLAVGNTLGQLRVLEIDD
jgi:WD40 repeat protein